jgi:hypothetical protein
MLVPVLASLAMARAAAPPPKIDTIVVLMEENRAFDHMLGWMARGGPQGDTRVDGEKPPFSLNLFKTPPNCPRFAKLPMLGKTHVHLKAQENMCSEFGLMGIRELVVDSHLTNVSRLLGFLGLRSFLKALMDRSAIQKTLLRVGSALRLRAQICVAKERLRLSVLFA